MANNPRIAEIGPQRLRELVLERTDELVFLNHMLPLELLDNVTAFREAGINYRRAR